MIESRQPGKSAFDGRRWVKSSRFVIVGFLQTVVEVGARLAERAVALHAV
jgi:hypothetical protein